MPAPPMVIRISAAPSLRRAYSDSGSPRLTGSLRDVMSRRMLPEADAAAAVAEDVAREPVVTRTTGLTGVTQGFRWHGQIHDSPRCKRRFLCRHENRWGDKAMLKR